jgi:hypothetical protein
MESPNIQSASSSIQPQGSSITDIEEGRSQTLNNISDLQNIEKEYFSKLNEGMAQNTLTQEEKDSLVQKINEISQMRVNLYKNLDGMYSFYHTNVSSTQNTIEEQAVAIEIVEKELNEAKLRLKAIEDEKNSKARLVEINTYYGERYNNHAQIMKIIILICIPVLILTILKNKGILSRQLYGLIVIIIVVVGIIYLGMTIIRSMSHDNMNFQEYTWNFNTADAPAVDTSNAVATDPWEANGTCQGQECCDTGYTYDPSLAVNKCVPNDSLSGQSATTETMKNMGYISGASESIFGANSNFAKYK